MEFFADIQDTEALKQRRKELMYEHHPDLGGDTQVAQLINMQYAQVALRLALNSNQRVCGSGDLSVAITGRTDGLLDQEQEVTVAVVTNKTRRWVTYATFELIVWTQEIDSDEEFDGIIEQRYYDFDQEGYFISRPLQYLLDSYHKRIIYGN
jgi:hypothetical protein